MTWLDDLTLDTVVVHLTTGRSLKGNKRSVYDDSIVLADADGRGDVADAQRRGHSAA
jgi:hypothetical protein